MRKLLKNVLLFSVLCVSVVTIAGTKVRADEQVFSADASGNWFGAGQLVDISSQGVSKVENELFGAGMDVRANNVEVDGSVFVAGSNVTVNSSKVGGSVFAAGSNITVDAEVKNNIWAVGSSIITTDNTSVKGLHVAGANAIVRGNYEAVSVSAGTVTFDAVVDGDVEIEADSVILGENASVGGKLTIVAKEEPENAAAIASSYEFKEVVKEESESEEDGEGVFGVGKKVGKLAAGAIILKKIKKMVLNLFRYALLAVVFAVVLKNNLTESYEMSTKRALPFWGFGALTLFCFPIVAVILCITIIGLPLAGLLGTIYVLAICFAKVFTFCSLVRELIFTHTSKRLHPIAETVLAVLPAAVIGVIPVIGGLVGLACAIYTLGYIVLAIAKLISNSKEQKTEQKAESNVSVEA